MRESDLKNASGYYQKYDPFHIHHLFALTSSGLLQTASIRKRSRQTLAIRQLNVMLFAFRILNIIILVRKYWKNIKNKPPINIKLTSISCEISNGKLNMPFKSAGVDLLNNAIVAEIKHMNPVTIDVNFNTL